MAIKIIKEHNHAKELFDNIKDLDPKNYYVDGMRVGYWNKNRISNLLQGKPIDEFHEREIINEIRQLRNEYDRLMELKANETPTINNNKHQKRHKSLYKRIK